MNACTIFMAYGTRPVPIAIGIGTRFIQCGFVLD
jgi:hypothetical protein